MNTIPLHRLPDEAFMLILRNMEVDDQLAYSICSKNTKETIKSLNLEANEINLSVSDSIKVEVCLKNSITFWSFLEHGNTFPNNELRISNEIEIRVLPHEGEMASRIWNFPNVEFKEWLHHFCEVLHHPRIEFFNFTGVNINGNCIEPMQKVVKGLPIGCLGICDDLTIEFAKKALESFPIYEKLYLEQISFGGHKLNQLLLQNLKSLCIPRADSLKIAQILISNSVRIKLNCSSLTEKELNRLSKLWIRGSNPRLKFFYTKGQPLFGSETLDKNLIMKGIKYAQVPMDSEEVYRDYLDEYYYSKTKLAGGFRIWKFDGTTAVIVVTERRFEFIVE